MTDQQKDNVQDKYKDNDKDILRTPPKSNPRDFWPLRHLFRVMRRHDMTKKNWQRQIQRQWQRQRHLLRAILETCDIWDTDYNSDNWEPEFMTIFVTWQLIVTLDSIRNSCDVWLWYHGRKWKSVELVNLVTFTVQCHQEVSSTKVFRASTSRTLLWDWLFDQILK